MFLSPHLLRLATDARLVALVRERHPAAFEAIYNRHHRAILSFCRHMLGDPQEAEDAVQHTFLSAYSDLITSEKPIQLRAWLFTIARNRCYSQLRGRREQPTGELEEPVTEGLASQVQRRQDLRELVVDLRRLPDEQRAALVLSELDALSHEEIAAALGVPREKVKALVFQARESLVASRNARETDCAEIREQLATQRGGALRRANLRRHLRECAGCRAFRRAVERQRRQLAVLLPVAPTVALKEGILGATVGGGAAASAGGGLLISTALKSGLAKCALGALVAGAGAATTIVATHGLQLPRRQAAPHHHGTSTPAPGAAAHRVARATARAAGSKVGGAPAPRVGAPAAPGAAARGRVPAGHGMTTVGGSGSFVRRGASNPFTSRLGVPKALRGGVIPRSPGRSGPSTPTSLPGVSNAPAASPVMVSPAQMTIPAALTSPANGHGRRWAGTSAGGRGGAGVSGATGTTRGPDGSGATGSTLVPQRGAGNNASAIGNGPPGYRAAGPGSASGGEGETGNSGAGGSGSDPVANSGAGQPRTTTGPEPVAPIASPPGSGGSPGHTRAVGADATGQVVARRPAGG